MTIGQVARRAGVRISAIRYYEAEGLLPAPPRVGGKRRYDGAVLETLAAIELAKNAGFELREIRTALTSSGKPKRVWQPLIERKRAELDRQIRAFVEKKEYLERLAGCGCATFEECGRRFREHP